MMDIYNNDEVVEIKNGGSIFTELFSLLKQYETLPSGLPVLAYKTEKLSVIQQHVDNAMESLLEALQDLGHLVCAVGADQKHMIDNLCNIGFLISAISNLTEALYTLRAEAEYVILHRKEARDL